MPKHSGTAGDNSTSLLAPRAAALVADDEARFLEVNAAASDLLKYSQDELKRLRVWDITVGAQRGDAREMWREFLSHGHQAGVYQVRRSDGRQITVQYEATANFRPGRHLSILRPVGPSRSESRPLDECPFDRPFPEDFDRCPAYQPRLAPMADSREQPVGHVWTCDHLVATRVSSAPAYYARCSLGDAVQRSRWLVTADEQGLLAVRKLRLDFYRSAQPAIRRLLDAQAADRARRSFDEGVERLGAAANAVRVALGSFIEHRGPDLAEAGVDVDALREAFQTTLDESIRRTDIVALRPPDRSLAPYPLKVQAFLRPDHVAARMTERATRP